jgi:DNA-binding transcriptional LysR family regulator
VTLTEAGHRYLERARDLLDAAAAAREVVATSDLQGQLRVTAPVALTEAWLASLLPEFLHAHPGLDVFFEISERHFDLVADGIDVAIRIGGPDSSTLTGRRLFPVERWFVASPAWVEQHGHPAVGADLEQHTGLIFAPSGTRPRGFPLSGGTITPSRAITATNGQPLRRFALDGLGVALLPDWLVFGDVERGNLIRVLADVDTPRLDLWVVWPQQRYMRAAARAFVEWFGERAV